MKSVYYISLAILFFQMKVENSYAQLDKQKKEEINITSSFKPSIIKSSKIEFRPDPVLKDTARYKFSYEPIKLSFNTPMSGFTIKPLAYTSPLNEIDSNQLIAHLGYGNFQSPLGSISYASARADQSLNLHADYLSMKGKLPGQQHAIGTLGASFKKRISENYQYNIGTNIEGYRYRTFGFDRNVFEIPDSALKQHFTNFNVHASLNNVAGEEGKIKVNPFVSFDHLTTNYKFNTIYSNFELPTDFKWRKHIELKASPSISWLHINAARRVVDDVFLVKIPLTAEIIQQKWIWDLSVIPVYYDKQFKFMPNMSFKHVLQDDKIYLKGGLRSKYEINTPYSMLIQNPFVRSLLNPNATVYEQHSLFAGLYVQSEKGLTFDFQAGMTEHKNLPLFVNEGLMGKDFAPIFEKSLRTIDLKSNFNYIVSEQLSLSTGFEWMIFQKQIQYEKPFGLLPLQMKFKASWKPIDKFMVVLNTDFWTGSYAKDVAANSLVKMRSAADINLVLKYKLNEKWGFWFDLNNIANIQYQRWNQYTAYGFNFIGGVKYVLGKKTKQ